MPDETPHKDEKKPMSTLMMNILVSSVLGFVCGGLGFALFAFLPRISDSEGAVIAVDLPPAFVPFGEVVANINEGRMSRYLRLNITLQVRGGEEEQMTADVESRRAILRNWLLGYLSSLQMEDLRGVAGQNRIRRDIQNQFNEILSPDGIEVVQDILFLDFTIQ